MYYLFTLPFCFLFKVENLNRPSREKASIHLQDFLATVHSLGVSFSIYHKDKWEWTSLLGGEKHLLLRKLPEHFHKLLPEDKVEVTKNLWIVSIHVFFSTKCSLLWVRTSNIYFSIDSQAKQFIIHNFLKFLSEFQRTVRLS